MHNQSLRLLIQTGISALVMVSTAMPQSGAPQIRLNQIGFYTQGPKMAVVVTGTATGFNLLDATTSQNVFSGTLGASATWAPSQETVRLADFGTFRTPGNYILDVPGIGRSAPFRIAVSPMGDLMRGSIKAYYFNRASTVLTAPYAGIWTRALGHPDDAVQIHASAVSTGRPTGTLISSPRGWYDAGDYNKYVVNSGISTYWILSAYEDYSALWNGNTLNIPESGNAVPDILDEALWNLRWMLSTQDPGDGGVYHKITEATFSGFVMPAAATATRYAVQKSVTAALDLAAVAAHASVLFRAFSTQLPGFADSCLQVAERAWTWARANPNATYNQTTLNQQFDPDILTGEYGDGNSSDEVFWAAVELFLATGNAAYYTATGLPGNLGANVSAPSWPNVKTLGVLSLSRAGIRPLPNLSQTTVRNLFINEGTRLRGIVQGSAYRVSMQNGNFNWGSNSEGATHGAMLLQAFHWSNDSTYLAAAVQTLDYLMGRNATGYSFVTGFGSKPILFPHHRQSASDGIAAPVPGWLSGGPNPGRQDGCAYPSTLPALAFLDSQPCYACNEITINWNAPMVYLLSGLEFGYAGASVNIRLQQRTSNSDYLGIQSFQFAPQFISDFQRDALGRSRPFKFR